MDLRLHHRACKVLNVMASKVGTGHDRDVLALVGLHVPTMSTKIRSLLDVDVASLEHTDNVAVASSKAFHQWSNT